MKYLGLILLGALAGVIGVLLVAPGGGTGVALNEPQFATATATQINCKAATSTVVATVHGRSSFIVSNVGTPPAYLCRAANGCTTTTGILIPPVSSSTDSRFVQVDAYTGAYSCIGVGTTSTLNIVYSQ